MTQVHSNYGGVGDVKYRIEQYPRSKKARTLLFDRQCSRLSTNTGNHKLSLFISWATSISLEGNNMLLVRFVFSDYLII